MLEKYVWHLKKNYFYKYVWEGLTLDKRRLLPHDLWTESAGCIEEAANIPHLSLKLFFGTLLPKVRQDKPLSDVYYRLYITADLFFNYTPLKSNYRIWPSAFTYPNPKRILNENLKLSMIVEAGYFTFWDLTLVTCWPSNMAASGPEKKCIREKKMKPEQSP